MLSVRKHCSFIWPMLTSMHFSYYFLPLKSDPIEGRVSFQVSTETPQGVGFTFFLLILF